MNSKHDDFFYERLQITEAIRNIQVEQSQPLRQVQVPQSTYNLAKKFIKHAPNALMMNGEWFYLRYEILCSLASEGGIYGLLSRDAGDISVKQADEKMSNWLDAIKHLLRYALNLLLAPKRPEFQSIKLYSSFYVYQISKKLNEAQNILMAMGYHPPTDSTSQDTQELRMKEVDQDLVAKTAADLVILQCDLELLKGNAKAIASEHPELPVSLADVLAARSVLEQIYTDTYNKAIARGIAKTEYPGSSTKVADPVPRDAQFRTDNYPPGLGGSNSDYRDGHPNLLPRGAQFRTDNYPPGLGGSNSEYHDGHRNVNADPAQRGVQLRYPTESEHIKYPPGMGGSNSDYRDGHHSIDTDPQQQWPRAHTVDKGQNKGENRVHREGKPFIFPDTTSYPLRQRSDEGDSRSKCSAPECNIPPPLGTNFNGSVAPHYRSQKSRSEDNILDRGSGQVRMPERDSLESKHVYQHSTDNLYHQSIRRASSSVSADSATDSMLISMSQTMPRPDPDDLPEPVFSDESAFTANNPCCPHACDESYSDSRVGIFIDSRSSFSDNGMAMFSPVDNRQCVGRTPGNVVVDSDGPGCSTNHTSSSDTGHVTGNQKAEVDSPKLAIRADARSHNRVFPDDGDDSRHSFGHGEDKQRRASPHPKLVIERENEKHNSKGTTWSVDPARPQEDFAVLSTTSPHSSPVIEPRNLSPDKHDSEGTTWNVGPDRPREDGPAKGKTNVSLEKQNSNVCVESGKSDNGFAIVTTTLGSIPQPQRDRAKHISEGSRSEYKQKNESKDTQFEHKRENIPEYENDYAKDTLSESCHSESNLDVSDGHFNASHTWTCDYCTFLNANSDATCEVCGIPAKQNSK